MVNFNDVKVLRDKLIGSLIAWGKGSSDGFYRSSPTSHSTPSFTNTGMVLQAFLESRNFHLAHDLAERMIAVLKSDYNERGIFPHEKAQGSGEGHTMCNAWASFAILDTFPNRVSDVVKICDWFLVSQSAEEGYWSLFPDEETKEPTVTGYAVSALQQFHQCCRQLEESGVVPPRKSASITPKIELAINYLLDSRPPSMKKHGLFLWPASINVDDLRKPLSLGTSALCMHVLSKWGRYRDRPELIDGVAATFKELLAGFRDDSDHYLEIRGQRLALWDQLHFNESKVHYLWNFFAPISLVTLMSLAERSDLVGDASLLRFMTRFSLWIFDHVCPAGGGTVGISGGETLAEPKVWSTAQSVIVLSRILDRRHLFLNQGQNESGKQGASGLAAPLPPPERSAKSVGSSAAENLISSERPADVFISYAVEDKLQALRIADVLQAKGVSYFLSEASIRPGDNWAEEVRRALGSCRVLCILMTSKSLGSEWVISEWAVAWYLGKRVIPVLLDVDKAIIPQRLQAFQVINFENVGDLDRDSLVA